MRDTRQSAIGIWRFRVLMNTPCLPFADKKIALEHIASVGSLVWVEFENGDPNLPIWTGFFYS